MSMVPVEIEIQLTPIFHRELPYINVSIDDDTIFSGLLKETTVFVYNNMLSSINEHTISIEFLNKKNTDCDLINELDKAISIEKIRFYGISSEYSLNNSVYYPRHAIKDDGIRSCRYMGWNGIWTTVFHVPVFSWIHKVEHLGWIYPK